MLLFFSVNKEDQDGTSLHKACLVHSHLTTLLTILTMFSVLHLFLRSLSSICMTPVPHSLEHISLQHSLGITVLSVRNWAQRRCTQVHVGTLGQSWILSQVFWILRLYPPLKHFFPCWHSPFLRKVSLWQTEWDWLLSIHTLVSLHMNSHHFIPRENLASNSRSHAKDQSGLT